MSQKQTPIKLTGPELEHLVCLLWMNERHRTYAGPASQYWARHKRLVAKINAGLAALGHVEKKDEQSN
jgi:hypothetical protein